jgi:uncharacterized protein (UPF0333 family)
MMDIKGQIALEYLLIFFVLIVILSVISIPLLISSLETTTDVTNAIETKSFLSEVQKNIKIIFSLDVGSKRTLSIYVPRDLRLYYNYDFGKHYLSTTLTLSDNTKKTIKIEVPCDVSFNGYINNHYVSLKKSWYYNTEVKWYTSSNGTRSINVNFK